MKKTHLIVMIAVLVCAPFSVNAQTTTPTTTPPTATTTPGRNNADKIARAKIQANREIDRRIASLRELSSRIQTMKHLTSADKEILKARIDVEIAALTALKAKIAAATDLAVIKEDIKSITKSYRIYALILPQIRILAAADRLITISGLLAEFSAKVKIRIDALAAEGKGVSSLNTALADFNAKTADAKVQADAAIAQVLALLPDNGDAAKAAANKQALADARLKIKAGNRAVKIARQDSKTIRQLLRMFAGNASTTPRIR